MSKRRETTTGMPTKKTTGKVEQPQTPSWFDRLLGNPTTRAEREEAINKLIVRSTGIVGGLIVLLVIIGLAYNYLYIPAQPVARVNGQAISVGEFRDRVNLEQARIIQLLINRQQQAQQQAQFQLQFYADSGVTLEQLTQQVLENDQQYQTWLNEYNFPDSLGKRVLDEMVDDVLIAQKATEMNVTVDTAKIEDSTNNFFGYDPTQVALIGAEPSQTPTPTITPTPFVSPTPSPTPLPTLTPTAEITAEATAETTAEATAEVTEQPTLPPSPTLSSAEVQSTYEANVQNYRTSITDQAGVGQNILDNYFRNLALRDAMTDAVIGENEGKYLYANVRHILVETEEEAQDILAALQAGESFNTLAQASSTDTGSGSRGGELGWTPTVQFVKEFSDAVETAAIGDIVGPVKTEFGYHIIQVRAREEREAEQFEEENIRAAIFARWLADLRETSAAGIEKYDNWVNYVPSR